VAHFSVKKPAQFWVQINMLVKARSAAPLQAALRQWLAPLKLRCNLRQAVDIDPQRFF